MAVPAHVKESTEPLSTDSFLSPHLICENNLQIYFKIYSVLELGSKGRRNLRRKNKRKKTTKNPPTIKPVSRKEINEREYELVMSNHVR